MQPTIQKIVSDAIDEGLFLQETHFPELGMIDTSEFHQGKVRDTYWTGDRGIMVTTDRISAGDVIMSTAIPSKGLILAEQTESMFGLAGAGAPNHLRSRPHPRAFEVERADVYPVEIVVRGYLTGSGWRDYQDGTFTEKYGIEITHAMVMGGVIKRDCQFREPLVTPTTKKEATDRPIKEEEAIELVGSREKWEAAKAKSLRAYRRAYNYLFERGIILPDTKFEMADLKDGIGFVDEIFTSDSSRFWDAAQYLDRFERGREQVMGDKEILRSWLQETGLWKVPGVPLPRDLQVRIIEGYANILARMTDRPREQVAGQLEEYFGRVRENGGVERDVYRALRDHGLLRGYVVALLLGSGSEGDKSDRALAKKVGSVLDDLELPCTTAIVSAHKDYDRFRRTVRWIDQYPGDVIFVDITGMSNAKGPATAGLTNRSVVSCYDNGRDKDTLDLASSVNVPRGVPHAVVNGPVNAALYAAQVLGYGNPDIRERVAAYRQRFAEEGLEHHRKWGGRGVKD